MLYNYIYKNYFNLSIHLNFNEIDLFYFIIYFLFIGYRKNDENLFLKYSFFKIRFNLFRQVRILNSFEIINFHLINLTFPNSLIKFQIFI
jgi:hypothetical protein